MLSQKINLIIQNRNNQHNRNGKPLISHNIINNQPSNRINKK